MAEAQTPSAVELVEGLVGALAAVQAIATQPHVDGRSLQAAFLTAQQLFQQQLLPTLAMTTTPDVLVTYQTEINRALRLLGIDVSFLQAAHNPTTRHQRQAQMRQRLDTLLDFSRGLQAALTEADSTLQP
ncbi:MAG TPA: heterocyst frequency control protein PatD [Candidatus Obscuribacterales bacterium]